MPDKIPLALWRNGLSVTGGVISLVATLFLLSFLFFDVAVGGRNPYLGVFTYLVFPVCLVIGFVLLLAGLLMARRRHKQVRLSGDAEVHYFPRIDLNLEQHRRVLSTIGVLTGLIIPVIGILSYRGYHYSDSNEFCGLVCHQVMEPQYVTFSNSPHAKVGCAECHIGSGAGWFVKSKLSGIRQVFAVAFNSYPRPIPPAIHELRPAKETCGECHWPEKFYGDQLVTFDRYEHDESNTQATFRLIMKTGGSDTKLGPPSGIHWHTATGHSVEFVATDEFLQNIPWVRWVDHETGQQRVYRSDGLNHDEPPSTGFRRTMDCMDCHNRPTHVFYSPDHAMDAFLRGEKRLRELPFAKREAVAALASSYDSPLEAGEKIAGSLEEFYKSSFPEVWQDRRGDVERLAEVTVQAYHGNTFPEMKVNWRTYPDNIGHKEFPGCFRCHNGDHVDREGRAISLQCNLCHDVLTPQMIERNAPVDHWGGFRHPTEIDATHFALSCDRCHTGGVRPPVDCNDCHADVVSFMDATHDAFAAFGIKQDSMFPSVKCEDCHDLSEPPNIDAMDAACMDCHEDEEERFEGMLADWHLEIRELLKAADERGTVDKRVLDALRKAGPLHNIEASRIILGASTDRSVRKP